MGVRCSYVPHFDPHGDDDDPVQEAGAVKRVLFVRHCQDEVYPVVGSRQTCDRFRSWHSQESRDLDSREDGACSCIKYISNKKSKQNRHLVRKLGN